MSKKVVVVGLVTGFALGAAGIAAAFIGTSGSGTGTFNTVHPTPLKVAIYHTNPTQSVLSGQHLTFTVSNTPKTTGPKVTERAYTPSAAMVTYTTPAHTGDITSLGSAVPGCKASWFRIKLTRWKYDTSPAATWHSLTPSSLTPLGHTYEALNYTLMVGQDLHVTILVTLTLTVNATQRACLGSHPRVRLTVK